jgi:acetylornithine/succinyldiaminopimelate/putrescine aminotransferase
MTWHWPRLLVLLALLMMPLGMAPAPASAPDHQMMAEMPMGHCPDQAPSHHGKSAFGGCTMACAAALPAIDRQMDEQDLIARELVQPVAVRCLDGLHPEAATPPPKIA